MQPNRREVLGWSAMTAAAAVLAVPLELRAALPAPTATLDEGDRAILTAMAALVYGPGLTVDVAAAIQETIGFLPEDKQSLVAQLPGLFNQLSRVLVPTVSAWVDLDQSAQLSAFEDWLYSSLEFRRGIAGALRQIILAHCYTNESTWASVGYPGPWLGRVGLPPHPLRFGEPS